ncbi:hypothetical protein FQN50_001182 [Emmonsiellopsis sp. PD_5]|nr:hypothetical protein FQN50_001182 [Emmonsiellopsis sp. PD_5]
MPTSPDQHNLKYGWLSKAQIEKRTAEEEARWHKIEAEKAQKLLYKPISSPWAPGVWEAAREARRNGTYPERLHPIILSSSGLFPSPREVQEIVGELPSTSEVGWATRATFFQEKEPEEPPEEDRLRFCEVDLGQRHRIEQCSDGEKVLVWVRGARRMGWLAKAKKEEQGSSGE